MDLLYSILLIIAYLSGSISSAILVCRLMTLPDPRVVGSHNPGATNVLRIGGSKAAFATLVGDILKTALPILLTLELGYTPAQASWLGVCSMIGHCFPVYFKMKGGKGVASMLTIISLVQPSLALLAFGCWLMTAWTFQRSSIASMLTALIIPIFCLHYYPQLSISLSALSIVVFIRHHTNVINIINGREPMIGTKKPTN